MKCCVTRWGGKPGFLRDDSYASNANNLDNYMFKTVCELGVVVAFTQEPTGQTITLLNERENHPMWEPWMNNLILDYENPDYSKYQVMFIQQGSDNLRITGANSISSQFYVYRALREFEGTVIGLSYDAYIPIWFAAETKMNQDQMYYTATTKEIFHNKSINILCAGNQPELYKSLYKGWGIDGFVNFLNFRRDTHDIMSGVLDEYRNIYQPNPSPINKLAFIGKDRNGGSRFKDFMSIMEKSEKVEIDLFGDWSKADFAPFEGNRIQKMGRVSRGINHVLDTYNQYLASPLISADRYVQSNQLTVRVFEVLSSRTLPLIESSWAKKFYEYMPVDLVNELTFDSRSIEELYIKAIEEPEWRMRMINEVYNSFRSSFVYYYQPGYQILELLNYCITARRTNGDDVVSHLAEYNYQRELESKTEAKRNMAHQRKMEYINYYSSIPKPLSSLSIKEVYGFRDSDLDEQTLLNKFGR